MKYVLVREQSQFVLLAGNPTNPIYFLIQIDSIKISGNYFLQAA